jgi:hypothetical protein
MAQRTDIILNSAGDLPLENLVWLVAPSDNQHIADCIYSFAGWWKQFPTYGVGVQKFLKSSGNSILLLKKTITIQLQNDGYNVGNTQISIGNDGVMKIIPNATR